MVQSGHKLRSLIIEDDPDQAALLKVLLTKLGHETRHLEGGHNLHNTMREFRPHAVFLDLGLQGQSGLDILNFLRRESYLRDTLVLVVSADTRQEVIVEALASGATDFIRKPYIDAELSLKVQNHIRIQELRLDLAISEAREKEHKEMLMAFLSPEVVQGIFDGKIKAETGGQEIDAIVMAVQLPGKEVIYNKLSPNDAVALINEASNDIIAACTAAGGNVVHATGDSWLIVFGVVDDIDLPLMLVKNSLEKIDGLDFDRNGFDLKPAIGVSHGKLFAGAVATGSRVQYTVLGEPVSRAWQLADAAASAGEIVKFVPALSEVQDLNAVH